MALTLDKINQLRKAKTNTVKYNGVEESRPYEKGALTKPNPLKIADEKLERIEKKTDRLLEKAKRIETKKEQGNYPSNTPQLPVNYQSTTTQNKRGVSGLIYQSMPSRKIPKQILNHIKQNIFYEKNECYSKIDSYELSVSTGKVARDLQLPIKRLAQDGWFEVIETSTSGYRLLKINPENYGLQEHE